MQYIEFLHIVIHISADKTVNNFHGMLCLNVLCLCLDDVMRLFSLIHNEMKTTKYFNCFKYIV